MLWSISKVAIAGIVISFSSWLAGRDPRLAGFILALPVSTLLTLALSHGEYRDPARSVEFARSVFWAVPLSLSFFVPFLFAEKLKWPFGWLYLSGVALLTASYFLHRALTS